MEQYKNIAGDSGIFAYEIGDDWINVGFSEGWLYHYTYRVTGPDNVEQMKVLAERGRGLSTYISRHVREKYQWKKKWRPPASLKR